jgi:6-phosphogluconolactonase (cycloisomerase 2 family)
MKEKNEAYVLRPWITVIALLSSVFLPATSVLKAASLVPVGKPIFDTDLEDPYDLVVSPDGKNIYVPTNWRGGALISFSRDTTTGQVAHMQAIKNGQGGADGLARPWRITMSNEDGKGKSVYVASGGSSAVSVFSRNTSTGVLTYLELQKGGVTWNGLQNCCAVALSPADQQKQQKHLYAVGHDDNTLVVFSRNLANGASYGQLTFVQVLRNDQGGLAGFLAPQNLAVTPDGKQVFVLAEGSDTLFIFNRNATTGQLSLAKAWKNKTEGLTGLVAPMQILFTSSGLDAYIACRNYGVVVLGRANANNSFTVLEQHANGTTWDWCLGGARGLALSADETRLYVAASGDHSLTAYVRDPVTGRIGKVAQARQWINGLREFTWPQAVAFSTGGTQSYAYVVTGADMLHCFKLRGSAGEMHWEWAVFGDDRDPNQVQGLRGGQKLCMAPDGLNVYVPGSEDNAIVSFRRNASTGALTRIQTIGQYADWYPPDCLDSVQQIIASPNKRDVYACSWNQSALVHFYRDATDGHLVFQGVYYNNAGVDDLANPCGITLSADNQHLYAVAPTSSSIVAFKVEGDGSLVFLTSFVNGSCGTDRLDRPTSLALSPDGNFLYVTAIQDDAILVFARNKQSGLLTYRDYVTGGVGGMPGLRRVHCVVVSPNDNGKHLYVGAEWESCLGCFSRDASTGKLAFLATTPNQGGACGVSMVFDSTGKYLYAPFEGANKIAAFERNASTGLLSLVDSKEGIPPEGLDGLDGAHSVVISPTNDYVYVDAWGDHCLSIFKFNK